MTCFKTEQHIVFAESEHGLERSISLMLKMANFKVTVVDDCLDAYEKLIEFDEIGNLPDLLIIDFGRHKENGERFVRNYTGLHLFVPLIIIAEYGDESMIGEELTAKSTLCISKPFEPQELMLGIENSLK